MFATERSQRLMEIEIGRCHPAGRHRIGARRRAPSDAAFPLVEGQANADGVEPGACVGPVEPVPRTMRPQVGLLRQVLRLRRIPDDRREPPDQAVVVLTNSAKADARSDSWAMWAIPSISPISTAEVPEFLQASPVRSPGCRGFLRQSSPNGLGRLRSGGSRKKSSSSRLEGSGSGQSSPSSGSAARRSPDQASASV